MPHLPPLFMMTIKHASPAPLPSPIIAPNTSISMTTASVKPTNQNPSTSLMIQGSSMLRHLHQGTSCQHPLPSLLWLHDGLMFQLPKSHTFCSFPSCWHYVPSHYFNFSTIPPTINTWIITHCVFIYHTISEDLPLSLQDKGVSVSQNKSQQICDIILLAIIV